MLRYLFYLVILELLPWDARTKRLLDTFIHWKEVLFTFINLQFTFGKLISKFYIHYQNQIYISHLFHRFEEIASVNFARGGGSTRSFDFEVETKNGVVHTFSSIEKEEYNRLYDFINGKKLRVKNTGRSVRSPQTFFELKI